MISRLTISFLLWMFLIFMVLFLESSAASDRVRLTDVSAITLHKGKMTTGRRSSPTMQLRCVGGSAKGAFVPKVVQCANQGHDGIDVQWRCDADLPHDIEFGAISVSCEGYDYAEDPYILRGSCGLEYELDYVSGSGNRHVTRKPGDDKWDRFATFVVVAFIVYVIYAMYSNRAPSDASGYRPGSGGSGGPGGNGGSGPGGYPSAPPPPYDDTGYGKPPPYGFRGDSQSGSGGPGCSSGGGASGSGSSGGGFWSGASLGAIGGYLASSYLNSGYGQPRNRGFFRDPGYMSSSDGFFSGASTSTSTRSSSGYGGTTRR